MAQGKLKVSNVQKSVGARKRKSRVAKTPPKGRKFHKPKGRKAQSYKHEITTTKAINKKNEEIVAAKAVGAGITFDLSDLKEMGKKELDEQNKAKAKKENKAGKLNDRLMEKLKKLGG